MGNDNNLEHWRRMDHVTKVDFEDSIKDGEGILYSKDGKRLLKGCDLHQLEVKEGTEVICDDAFNNCYPIDVMNFPKLIFYKIQLIHNKQCITSRCNG